MSNAQEQATVVKIQSLPSPPPACFGCVGSLAALAAACHATPSVDTQHLRRYQCRRQRGCSNTWAALPIPLRNSDLSCDTGTAYKVAYRALCVRAVSVPQHMDCVQRRMLAILLTQHIAASICHHVAIPIPSSLLLCVHSLCFATGSRVTHLPKALGGARAHFTFMTAPMPLTQKHTVW